MRDPNNPCLFCNPKESGIAHENDLAYASYDTYPVSDHHCLIIPKRHVVDYFELSDDEIIACKNLVKIIKKEVLDKDKSVKAFNIGTNAKRLYDTYWAGSKMPISNWAISDANVSTNL